jgi:glycosyltransferase involved in cell wall biosynthesis
MSKYYFVTFSPFPHGGAISNRIHSLAKGVNENGGRAVVLITLPTESKKRESKIENISGIYDGVEYTYVSNKVTTSTVKYLRVFSYLRNFYKTYLIIKRSKKDIDAVVFFPSRILYYYFFIIISKLVPIKLFIEINEYPFIHTSNSLFLRFILRKIYNSFDGIFVMTSAIFDYIFTRIRNKDLLCKIPMTVDLKRFEDIEPNRDSDRKIITYVGNPKGTKDGVKILIKSFALLCNKFDNIKLNIVGNNPNDKKTIFELQSLAEELKIDDNVLFKGFVSRELIPQIISDSNLLVLARPANKKAEGGFPTKLGEYLASGTPVVVTKVGEIPAYLEDQKSAYLAKPNNIEDFYLKMKLALEDYEKALEIGNRGKQVAQNSFNYKKQAKVLIEFIQKMI